MSFSTNIDTQDKRKSKKHALLGPLQEKLQARPGKDCPARNTAGKDS